MLLEIFCPPKMPIRYSHSVIWPLAPTSPQAQAQGNYGSREDWHPYLPKVWNPWITYSTRTTFIYTTLCTQCDSWLLITDKHLYVPHRIFPPPLSQESSPLPPPPLLFLSDKSSYTYTFSSLPLSPQSVPLDFLHSPLIETLVTAGGEHPPPLKLAFDLHPSSTLDAEQLLLWCGM